MSVPPPRPPPPTSPRLDVEGPQSRPHSGDFGAGMETGISQERRRSNTFSAPMKRHQSPNSESSNPPPPPPTTPTRPMRPFRHTSSSPPPSLPTLTEGGKGRGKGMNLDGRQRPSRPPPPVRARSLPRGLYGNPGTRLKIWEHANGNVSGGPYSKSSENVHRVLREGSNSPAHTDSLGSVLNRDHNRLLSDNNTPVDMKVDSDGTQSDSTNQAGNSGTPTSPPPVTNLPESTPSPTAQPVVPPRPYLPPRPFAPPSSSSHSPRSKHQNRTHKTHHGDPRRRVPPEPVAVDTRSNSLDAKKRPDVMIGQKSRDATPSDEDVTPQQDVTSRDDVTSPDEPPAAAEEPSGSEETTGEGEIVQQTTKTLFDINNVSQTPSPYSGGKSHRFFSSLKKGISKMRHKNVRSSSVPTSRPPPRRDASLDTLNQIKEEIYPDPLPQGIVDPMVVLCVAYLNRDCVLREAGLFRIPGDFATVKKLRSDYIRGQPINLMEILDPHTVAGLMKCHFREWRVSIIPRGKPLEAVTAAVRDKDVEGVRTVLQGLSQDSLATLRMVTELLSKVVEYSEWNKMTAGTLATSCGPSFFPYLPASPANTLLKFMIDNCTTLFPE